MNLSAPRNYRLKREQEAFLQASAQKAGHDNRSLALRLLIDREMAKAERTKKAARGSRRASQ